MNATAAKTVTVTADDLVGRTVRAAEGELTVSTVLNGVDWLLEDGTREGWLLLGELRTALGEVRLVEVWADEASDDQGRVLNVQEDADEEE